jgi:hypothetical protein
MPGSNAITYRISLSNQDFFGGKMKLSEVFINRQGELRGAELKGFMQPGNSDQILLLFEKNDKLMALNISERKNGDNLSLGTELDLYEMLS